VTNRTVRGFDFNLEANRLPIAVITPPEQEAVVGSVVLVDGRASVDPEGRGLSYQWVFTQVPIGSQVERDGFTDIEDDSSIVSFAPDVIGHYQVQLIVNDGTDSSEPALGEIDTRLILVPHHKGFIPDAKFIWNYLSDFWNRIEGKDRVETFWSGAIMMVASELLKLYQIDYNKSIKDVQALFQHKWMSYAPVLSLDDQLTYTLADDLAGSEASTFLLDPDTGEDVSSTSRYGNSASVPETEGSFETTGYGKPMAAGKLLLLSESSFTMVRATRSSAAERSLFFADQVQIITNRNHLSWRFSATLVSTTTDFEQMGVHAGDTLEIEVCRKDLSITSTLWVQVVSVDRYRLGFVFNTEQLQDGVAASGLSEDAQMQLASDLRVDGLSRGIDGQLHYEGDAETIRVLLTSTQFRREYFEEVLPLTTEIDLELFVVTLRPVCVYRNKTVPVDERLRSIPILQEYVKQPELVEQDGQLLQFSEGKLYVLSHRPYVLVENLDFILDDETTIRGSCDLQLGIDTVKIPYGDLIDRSIREGDELTVSAGALQVSFTVVQVLDAENLRVTPVPTLDAEGATFKLTRKVPGRFIRFINNTFTPDRPAPKRLWSEVSYYDNNDSIEANFGVLVGLTVEQLEKQNAEIKYRGAVAGLLYALATGPTISNLALATQILLGLPFTQSAGVISEINPTYRLRSDGSPLMGRILVSETGVRGESTGLTSIYFYPQGRQLLQEDGSWLPATPEQAGLAINPKTGKVFTVGDQVDAFVRLSKGVEVQDYIGIPTWYQRFVDQGDIGASIDKYHSFEVQMNSDLVSAADIDLAAQFLASVRPGHTKFRAGLLKPVEDIISIEDSLLFGFGRPPVLFDTVGLSLPGPMKFDLGDNENFLFTVDGKLCAFYLRGEDLVTTQGSDLVTSPSGGFQTARPVKSERHDEPFLRVGDLLYIIGGHNAGYYNVLAVNGDTELQIELDGRILYTGNTQEFVVYRPIKNPIYNGVGAVTQGTSDVLEVDGLFSGGVAAGDRVFFYDPGDSSWVGSLYTITVVNPNSRKFTVDRLVIEESGLLNFSVIRWGLVSKYLCDFFGDGAEEDEPFTVSCTAGDESVILGGDSIRLGQIAQGDTLYLGPSVHTIYAFHRDTLTAFILPVAPDYSGTAKVWRTYRAGQPMSTDLLDRIPGESLLLTLNGSEHKVSTQVGSNQVTWWSDTITQDIPYQNLGIQAGDLLVLYEGADSLRDVGFGLGIFPISSAFNENIYLTCDLTEAHPTGVEYGIRRQRPYEG